MGAFRVAIELDLKREGNDKKINLLFAEVGDMMTTLLGYALVPRILDGPLLTMFLRLRDVKEPGRVGKDGKTVQEGLQGLVDLIKADILDCANTCDAYAKTGMPSRALGSVRWNKKLQQYIKRITKHRIETELALAIHLDIDIDIVNRKFDSIDSKYAAIDVSFRPLALLITSLGSKTCSSSCKNVPPPRRRSWFCSSSRAVVGTTF